MMIEATWSTNEVCVVTKADIHVVDCSPWTELVAFMTTSPIDDALTKGIRPYARCHPRGTRSSELGAWELRSVGI